MLAASCAALTRTQWIAVALMVLAVVVALGAVAVGLVCVARRRGPDGW